MFNAPAPKRSAGMVRRVATTLLAVAAACAVPSVPARAAGDAAPAADQRAEGKPYTQKIPGSDVSFNLVPIPAGKFQMGSPDSEKKRKKDEGPQFTVEVEPFWMGATEVTQAEYELYLEKYHLLAEKGAPPIPKDKMADAVTYPTPMYELEAGPILQRMGRGGKFPAVIMSQYAARQYTKWLSKKTGHFFRLPTEAEWEYAARAGTDTAYDFGKDAEKLEDYAWFIENSPAQKNGDTQYHEVGKKKPNPWGLYDIYGNVAEWCIDAYAEDWYKQFAGKTVKWNECINWPKEVYPRVIRGGGYDSEPEECRSASRYASSEKLNVKDPQIPQSPHWMSDGFWVGFRVVSPVKEPTEAEKHKFWDVDDDYTKEVLQRDREIRDIPEQGK
jgi:formylglycine-generating enzyme required for sulfatase activity